MQELLISLHAFQMARGGFIRMDRQRLKQLLAECELEWLTLNREVKRINRVRVFVCIDLG